MAEFKTKEEYEKWKAERAKKAYVEGLNKKVEPIKAAPKPVQPIPPSNTVSADKVPRNELSAHLSININHLGFAGAVLLGIGVFLPFVRLPIVGSINYFNNGQGFGAVLLVGAFISMGLIFFKKMQWLVIPPVLSSVPLGYTAYKIKFLADEIVSRPLPGNNPFSGMANAMVTSMAESVHVDIGVFVMFMGIVLQLVSYLVYRRQVNQ